MRSIYSNLRCPERSKHKEITIVQAGLAFYLCQSMSRGKLYNGSTYISIDGNLQSMIWQGYRERTTRPVFGFRWAEICATFGRRVRSVVACLDTKRLTVRSRSISSTRRLHYRGEGTKIRNRSSPRRGTLRCTTATMHAPLQTQPNSSLVPTYHPILLRDLWSHPYQPVVASAPSKSFLQKRTLITPPPSSPLDRTSLPLHSFDIDRESSQASVDSQPRATSSSTSSINAFVVRLPGGPSLLSGVRNELFFFGAPRGRGEILQGVPRR